MSSAKRSRPRRWEVRSTAPPRASFEELEIRTQDGAALRGVVDDPPEGVPIVATCVLAHAMFARKTSFGRRDRPGLAHALTAAGMRTVAFDFRGHGESALPPNTDAWGYDDLVRYDLPAVVEAARFRAEDRPVIVVGHSLGGHVALAAQGSGRMNADAIVGIAAGVWLGDFESSRPRRAIKRIVAGAALQFVRRTKRVPARALGLGSDDESARYLEDILRVTRERRWVSADGADDYRAGLSRVTVPVANVLGARDRWMCHPCVGEAFVRSCAGPVAIFEADAGHMELVTSPAHHHATLAAVSWAVKILTPLTIGA